MSCTALCSLPHANHPSVRPCRVHFVPHSLRFFTRLRSIDMSRTTSPCSRIPIGSGSSYLETPFLPRVQLVDAASAAIHAACGFSQDSARRCWTEAGVAAAAGGSIRFAGVDRDGSRLEFCRVFSRASALSLAIAHAPNLISAVFVTNNLAAVRALTNARTLPAEQSLSLQVCLRWNGRRKLRAYEDELKEKHAGGGLGPMRLLLRLDKPSALDWIQAPSQVATAPEGQGGG